MNGVMFGNEKMTEVFGNPPVDPFRPFRLAQIDLPPP